ncbi:MAG: phosphatase PAP2 family protein [Candidatus Marinimicrobia bacterium]|jgi:undecaprenyl-diphosphatase|nr:phosphatase PAP2 family protein [Candidatus Neomarinimicrobiota bacterium]MBT3675691.1 phosphatase PAP2 family protein [Candidatus Neomarinimicrobiota bacterium]MBT3763731.1 phosphatase PAP2 family protein [Candidatus Neomarinimicrobiota bacterium]MBT4068359.1 phosphatase PAP2 family protein [Candidatus Neomarinimicrobiota bacterium]MBT4271058.1 phosphatase PAP2 family protein [Candidatus Neomarinimicrobiota bacterium]
MLEFFINVDKAIFHFFNTTTANPIFDFLMPIITNQNIWAVPILFIVFYLAIKGGRRGQICVVILIVSVGLADYTSASILKPFFQRLRPSHELTEGIRVLMGKGGKYGFVSSHAANMFAAAVVFSYFYERYNKVFFTIATMIAFSRVYVGVHYPADIIFGGLLGYGLSWAVLSLWVIIKMRELKRGAKWILY